MFYIPQININSEQNWLDFIQEIKNELKNRFEITDQKLAIKTVKESILKSFKHSIPDEKFAIFFSGGVDSVLLTFLAKQFNLDFDCYLSVLDYPGFGTPHDLERAITAAQKLSIPLNIIKTNLEQLEKILPKVIQVLKNNNPVPVSVIATLWPVLEQTKKDSHRYFMTGMGVEQTHAGGDRYRHTEDINKLCWERLSHWRNGIWRDAIAGRYFGLKMITPFYAQKFIKAGMSISGNLKKKNEHQKYIFRLAAIDLGLPQDLAMRRARPAQYASKFDRGIERLAKDRGFKFKHKYLESIQV